MKVDFVRFETGGDMVARPLGGTYVFIGPRGGLDRMQAGCEDADEAMELADAINGVYERRRRARESDRILAELKAAT